MPGFLTKEGGFVFDDGAFVTVENPAGCACCGSNPTCAFICGGNTYIIDAASTVNFSFMHQAVVRGIQYEWCAEDSAPSVPTVSCDLSAALPEPMAGACRQIRSVLYSPWCNFSVALPLTSCNCGVGEPCEPDTFFPVATWSDTFSIQLGVAGTQDHAGGCDMTCVRQDTFQTYEATITISLTNVTGGDSEPKLLWGMEINLDQPFFDQTSLQIGPPAIFGGDGTSFFTNGILLDCDSYAGFNLVEDSECVTDSFPGFPAACGFFPPTCCDECDSTLANSVVGMRSYFETSLSATGISIAP